MNAKFTDFPKLPDVIKELISAGRYSFYKLKDGTYLLIAPGKPDCGCGHSNERNFYKSDIEGNLEEIHNSPESPAIEAIRFDLPENITDKFFKARFNK